MARFCATIAAEAGLLRVTESLQIDNPSKQTYVGKPHENAASVTLSLNIPKEFKRITFDNEFHGRHFRVIDGRLCTGIPWTPGPQTIEYTYVLPNEQSRRVWERPLDLPCSDVEIRVQTAAPGDVTANLPPGRAAAGELVFQSRDNPLPAGHVLRVELGRLPLPWMAYAKWAAIGALAALVAGMGTAMMRKSRRDEG